MNTRGEIWLLWKGPTVCHFICVLCHNFWTNYDLDLFSTSKWPSELQFCEKYLCKLDGKKLARHGLKTATYYAASFLLHCRRVLFSHLLFLWRNIVKVFDKMLDKVLWQTEAVETIEFKGLARVIVDFKVNWKLRAFIYTVI